MRSPTRFGKLSGLATNSEVVRQAVKFGMVGILNTAIGLGVIYALMWGAGINPFAANMLGYSLALINSYFVNKIWTFRDKREGHGQFFVFLLVFALCYGLQLIVLWLLIKSIEMNPYIAQLLAMVVYTIVNFVGNKLITFRAAANDQSTSEPENERTVV